MPTFASAPEGHASAHLALWVDAWRRSHASPDDVVDAMSGWADVHLLSAEDPVAAEVLGGSSTNSGAQPRLGAAQSAPREGAVVAILAFVRACGSGARMRVVLPAPGDVDGLEPGSAHSRAAIDAGETLLISPGPPAAEPVAGGMNTALGLVPRREGGDVIHWRAYALAGPELLAPRHVDTLGATRHALATATREATARLAGIARTGDGGADARETIAAHVARAHSHRMPPGTDPRVGEITDSAATLAAILSTADAAGPAVLVTSGAAAAEDAVRELWSEVRRARASAIAAVLETDAAERSPHAGFTAAPRERSSPPRRGRR